MALYVDILLAFRARAENLGRRARRKMPGSILLLSFLAAIWAEGQARRPEKATRACHQRTWRLLAGFLRARPLAEWRRSARDAQET